MQAGHKDTKNYKLDKSSFRFRFEELPSLYKCIASQGCIHRILSGPVCLCMEIFGWSCPLFGSVKLC